MNKLLFTILIVIFSIYSKAQILYGYIRELNSDNTPVKRAVIKSTNANQITSTDKGEYTLRFQAGKPGNAVLLFLEKDGFVVTDKTKLTTTLSNDPLNNPHVIIVCPKDKWRKIMDASIDVCEKTLRISYEKKVTDLNQRLNDLKKDNNKYITILDSLRNEIQLLTEQYNEQLEDIIKIAEEHSKQNLDELNELEQKAYYLFNEGKIEESLALRESMKSMENIEKRNAENKQMTQTIDNNNAANAIDRNNLKQQAKEAALLFKWDKVEIALEFLARDTTDYKAISEYATFLYKQNHIDQAQKKYEQLLNLLKCLAKNNPNTYEPDIAITLNYIGRLFVKKHDYIEAEKYHKESFEIRKHLAKNNSESYESAFAETLNNMGILYKSKRDYTLAEKYYKESLEIRRRLAKNNPEVYEIEVAKTLNNIGVLHRVKNDYFQSEQYYKESLEIKRRLLNTNSNESNKLSYSITLNTLGFLFVKKHEYTKAEQYYKESIEIRRQLAKNNPEAYEPDLAKILNYMGILYKCKRDYTLAEKYYKESLEIRRRLAKNNPDVYEISFTVTLNNLGNLYEKKYDYIQAEQYYKESLEIYRHLINTNTGNYMENFAETLNNLGVLYEKKNDYSQAEHYYKESLETRRRLAKNNPEVFESVVAITLNNLGNLYRKSKNYTQSEQYYKESLEIRRHLAKNNPEVYGIDVAITLNNFGMLYFDKQDYILSEQYYNESLKIKRRLAKTNPEAYEIDIAETLENFEILYKEMDNLKLCIIHLTEEMEIYKKWALINYEYYYKYGNCYGKIAWYYILLSNYVKAEEAANEALKPNIGNNPLDYDEKIEWVYTKLAPSLLLQGKYEESKDIYLQYKDKPYNKSTYKDTFLTDFDDIEKAGIKHPDIQRMRELLMK